MCFFPYSDDGHTERQIRYKANYCWNCGEKLEEK